MQEYTVCMDDIYKTRRTLLQRLKDGSDEKSWQEFVSTYKVYICVVISRMGVNDNDTEDLSQQVMLKLWKLLPEFTYDDKKRFRSYVARITQVTVYDYYRKKYKEEQAIDKDLATESSHNITLPDIEKLINEEWENFIINLAMSNIKKGLNLDHLSVFERLISGEEAEDIADDTGIKKNSVHQIYKRIKEKFHKHI